MAIETEDYKKQFKQRTAIGSIKLIVCFIIITTGFIIGVIASGIPLTQLTVLMGALGVGIGFGLQNIFNNLVSGLIIAIEKPFSVGDMVELGKDTGWIKEIGIRASNMQTFEGAEIIVPNGELISNKVTNWTLSNKRRRIEIGIGVSYKSDPHKVHDLMLSVLENHPEIRNFPSLEFSLRLLETTPWISHSISEFQILLKENAYGVRYCLKFLMYLRKIISKFLFPKGICI